MDARESGKRTSTPRTWWGRYQVLTVAALGALVVVVVLAVTPAGPRILHSKEAGLPSSLVISHYTCDLAGYGYRGPPVTMATIVNTTQTATAFAMTGFSPLFSYSGPVSLSTTAATLPPSVAVQLANLSRITLEATVAVSGAPAAAPVAKIYGSTDDPLLPTGPLTQLQVATAFDTAFFSTAGTALLDFPARSLRFTPYRDYQPLPPITCTVVPGPVTPSSVSVSDVPVIPAVSATASGTPTSLATATPAPPGAPAPASALVSPPASTAPVPAIPAPTYACTSNFRTPTYRTPLPMTVTTAGVPAVGRTLTVTLSSPPAGLGAPAPGLATRLAFTGRLPLRGAQPGSVNLKETTFSADRPTFTVSARLRLKRAGVIAFFYPRRFGYTVYLPDQQKAVFTCALAASPVPVALTVRVVP